MLTVILSLIDEDRIDAACSTPVRKLAGAATAAASKMRLIVKPVLDVMVTVEPTPPEPLWLTAAWASTDSAEMVGVSGMCGEELSPPWRNEGRKKAGMKFGKTGAPSVVR